MVLALTVFGMVSGLELLLWLPPLWARRQPVAQFLVAALAVASGLLLAAGPRLWIVVLVFFNLYRLFNLWRVIKGRIQADYLYHAARRTSFWLIGFQLADLGLAKLIGHYHVGLLSWLYWIAAGQIAVGLVLLATTLRHLRTIRPPQLTSTYADRELPSLTVAVPARNETSDLEACLQSLVASDYPKLEILVLDDCSQNKRTPEVIRGFAHAGVRFLAGLAPPGHWLAKNYAYSQLAEAANGELLLFCGVDVRFKPDSLRTLVKILLQKKKSMLSVLPVNRLSPGRNVIRQLAQPNRYAWELCLPRRWLKRPPVLSTCWLITRQALRTAGGFAAAARKCVPESYLARQTAMTDDGYSFLLSDDGIGVSSHKRFDDQQATATRTRYPQLHRRPEMAALVSLAEFGALLWPLVISVGALLSRAWLLAALAGIAYLLVAAAYDKIVNLTYRKIIIGDTWFLPVAVIYDITILNYSMWRYESGEVIWKGRNVCIPVMRAVTDTPKQA